jgi:hypothetical protein
MKTNELIGPALDWAVAKCEGVDYNGPASKYLGTPYFNYSTNWAQGGPIIEREKIVLIAPHDDIEVWEAYHPTRTHDESYGPTPLIAAMRCYCCAELGANVEVPEELK